MRFTTATCRPNRCRNSSRLTAIDGPLHASVRSATSSICGFSVYAAPQALSFLRRRRILGHRGFDERFERPRVDLLAFVDVDCPSRVAFQAGVEEARWVWDA